MMTDITNIIRENPPSEIQDTMPKANILIPYPDLFLGDFWYKIPTSYQKTLGGWNNIF